MDALYTADRTEWRRWLEVNHASAGDVWLVTYRKKVGKPSLPYPHAVEEALCFGWIDSVRKSLDDERLAQRFSPRRSGSPYSQINIERLRRLAAEDLVMPGVLASIGDLLDRPFEWPSDVMTTLRENELAWMHFQGFPEAYRRIRVAYVDGARKRPDEFRKRLDHLIDKTASGKQFGYGIEDFY